MEESLVVVEDDYYEWEWIKAEIEAAIPAVKILWVSTEKMFRDRLAEFINIKPVGFILDVMLPWDTPQPNQSEDDVPADVKSEGFYTAGLRCKALLKQQASLQDIPVLLYTGLDENSFNEPVLHVKSEDPKLLTDLIKVWLAARRR